MNDCVCILLPIVQWLFQFFLFFHNMKQENILRLMRNLSNGTNVMTGATLNRKFQGEVDFTCAEILLISHIFGLDKQEILDIFHLFPNFPEDNSEK